MGGLLLPRGYLLEPVPKKTGKKEEWVEFQGQPFRMAFSSPSVSKEQQAPPVVTSPVLSKAS